MPSFRHLSVKDRWALVQFLKTLGNFFDDYDEVVVNRFDPDGDQAHVTNVVVAAEHRRRGVARRLLLALAREIIRRGCVAWTLEVRASSEGAQALYRSFGFVPAGVRTRYYDHSEDAIVMWCHDIDTPAYAARLRELAA
jgi:ribosomal-protein-alanine N-acetyltransferase